MSILSFMDFLFSMGSLSTPLLVNYFTSSSAWASLSGIGLMAGTMGAKSISYLIGVLADQTSLAESYRYVSWAVAALLLCVLAFLSLHVRNQGSRDEPSQGGAHPALDSSQPPDAPVVFNFNPLKQAFNGIVSSLESPDSRFSPRAYLRRALLDVELQSEFEALFGKKHRLTRDEALIFLNHAWDKYPLMRELYPSPAEILAEADQNPRHR